MANQGNLANSIQKTRYYPAVKSAIGEEPLFSVIGYADGTSSNEYQFPRSEIIDTIDISKTNIPGTTNVKGASDFVTRETYNMIFPLKYNEGINERVDTIDDSNAKHVSLAGIAVEYGTKSLMQKVRNVGYNESIAAAKDGITYNKGDGTTFIVKSKLVNETFVIDILGGLDAQLVSVVDQLRKQEVADSGSENAKLEYKKNDATQFGIIASDEIKAQLSEDKAFAANDAMATTVLNQAWKGPMPAHVLVNGTPVWFSNNLPRTSDTQRIDYMIVELPKGEIQGSVKLVENQPITITIQRDQFNQDQDLISGRNRWSFCVVKPDLVAVGSTGVITVSTTANTRGQKTLAIAAPVKKLFKKK
jgi:hypothetical protein